MERMLGETWCAVRVLDVCLAVWCFCAIFKSRKLWSEYSGKFFFTKHNQNKEENSCIQLYRAKVCPWVCLFVCLYLKCLRACEDMFLQPPGGGNKQGQTDVTTISIEWKRFKGQPCPHDPTPDTGQQRASGGAPTAIGGNGSTSPTPKPKIHTLESYAWAHPAQKTQSWHVWRVFTHPQPSIGTRRRQPCRGGLPWIPHRDLQLAHITKGTLDYLKKTRI